MSKFKTAQGIARLAEDLVLPPAANAARTQIIGTLPTYEKAGQLLQARGGAGRGLDFGAGLGEGAKKLPGQWDTYEPFAQKWQPTYSDISQIPPEMYGQLTNLNVLNVVPREIRDEIVRGIGKSMQPGGLGVITTRGRDVMSASGRPGPEPMSMITSRDTYQKGFTNPELQDYLRYILGDRFDIEPAKLGPAGALLRKKAEGGLAHLAGGGQPIKMFQQLYRGYAGKPGAEQIFASPQRRVAEYYAQKRAAQTGLQPGIEAVQVDPSAGVKYGHALPIDQFNKDVVTTQARKLSPLDVLNPAPNKMTEAELGMAEYFDNMRKQAQAQRARSAEALQQRAQHYANLQGPQPSGDMGRSVAELAEFMESKYK